MSLQMPWDIGADFDFELEYNSLGLVWEKDVIYQIWKYPFLYEYQCISSSVGGYPTKHLYSFKFLSQTKQRNFINSRQYLLTNNLYQKIKIKKPKESGVKTYLRLTDSQNDINKIQINSAKIYMRWFRDVSDEELKFASIADQCPWLENKLIDFSYFSQHELITPNDESLLKDTINNNLRKVNGQLMQYTKSYYDALHSRTKDIAELTNSLDLLGAEMEASIYSPYSKEGDIKESDFESVYNTYNAIWIPQQEPKTILNYGELMTEYFNKYFSAQQRFLKNIYNFRNYWDKPIGFAGTGIYENKVIIENMTSVESPNIVLFGDLTWKKIDSDSSSNFNLYKTGELGSKIPVVNLYSDSYNFEKIDIINEYNYTNFYTPTVKANSWTKCKENSKLLSEVFYAEIDCNLLVKACKGQKVTFEDLNKFPEVNRDLALLIDTNITYEQIESLSFKTEKRYLKSVNLFDVYQGKNIESGKKSYAIRYVLSNKDKTLTNNEITNIMDKLVAAYEKELGAKLRT